MKHFILLYFLAFLTLTTACDSKSSDSGTPTDSSSDTYTDTDTHTDTDTDTDTDRGTSNPLTWDDLASYISFDDHDSQGLYDHTGRLFYSNLGFDSQGIRGECGVVGNGVAYTKIPDSMDASDPFNFNENLFSFAFWFKSDDKSLDQSTKAGDEVEIFTRTGYTMAWGLERTDDDADLKTWLRFQSRASDAIFSSDYQDQYPDFCYFNNDGDRNLYCPNDSERALQDVEYRQDSLSSANTNRDLRDGKWHHIVLTHKPFKLDMDGDGDDDVLPLSSDGMSINPALIKANKDDGHYYRLYIDGILEDEETSRLKDFDNNGSTDTEDTKSISNKIFVIGGGIGGGDEAETILNGKDFNRLFHGELDEIYLFHRDLSKKEVELLYTWR
jgi:hypothetical protein